MKQQKPQPGNETPLSADERIARMLRRLKRDMLRTQKVVDQEHAKRASFFSTSTS